MTERFRESKERVGEIKKRLFSSALAFSLFVGFPALHEAREDVVVAGDDKGSTLEASGPAERFLEQTTFPKQQTSYVTRLIEGSAHLVPDYDFQAEFAGNAEIETVFVDGEYRMFYRTYKRADGQDYCTVATGVAMAISRDGKVFNLYNKGRPLHNIESSGSPSCPDTEQSSWKYAPDVVAVEDELWMFYEQRDEVRTNPFNWHHPFTHSIHAVRSTDGGFTWGDERIVFDSDRFNMFSPVAEIGTPSVLIEDGRCYLTFHAARFKQDGVKREGFRRAAAVTEPDCNYDSQYHLIGNGESIIPQRTQGENFFGYGNADIYVSPVSGRSYIIAEEWWSQSGLCELGSTMQIVIAEIKASGENIEIVSEVVSLFNNEGLPICYRGSPDLSTGENANEIFITVSSNERSLSPDRFLISSFKHKKDTMSSDISKGAVRKPSRSGRLYTA